MRCEYGYCVVCDKELTRCCETCGIRSRSPEYSEVEVTWTNGSVMRIAVCMTCVATKAWTTPESKRGITEAHWAVWDQHGATYDKGIVIA